MRSRRTCWSRERPSTEARRSDLPALPATIFRGRFAPSPPAEPTAEAPMPAIDAAGRVPTLPASTYATRISPARDRARNPLPDWHIVCHVSEIAEAGAYVTLDVLGRRGFVMRGEDGEIRALRMSAGIAPMPWSVGAPAPASGASCAHHAWTYVFRANRRASPPPRPFRPAIDRSTLGLFTLDCETFIGLRLPALGSRRALGRRALRAPCGGASDCSGIARRSEPISEAWQGEIEGDWEKLWTIYLRTILPDRRPGAVGLMSASDKSPPEPGRSPPAPSASATPCGRAPARSPGARRLSPLLPEF